MRTIPQRYAEWQQVDMPVHSVLPASLADLYDDTFMPPELRKAHQANDAAVLAAYGLSPKASESEIVSKLFELYAKLTAYSTCQCRGNLVSLQTKML